MLFEVIKTEQLELEFNDEFSSIEEKDYNLVIRNPVV